jgi:hypothetical protein
VQVNDGDKAVEEFKRLNETENEENIDMIIMD